MTDKLRAAAEMALEALEAEIEFPKTGPALTMMKDSVEALRQALDQLPDTTKMIEPSIIIVGWMYEDQLPEIYPYEEMFQFSVVDGVRMFPVYAPKAEPDTGTDRGAWSDVPDATKWVDELRGDDPSNSTTDVVGPEPVAWLWKNKDGHQVITDDPDYADGTWVPLYTAPPKPDLLNQTCCECWGKATKREWQGLTDEEIAEAVGSPIDEVYLSDFRKVEAKLKEKNT